MKEGHTADDVRAAYLHYFGLFDISTFKTVVSVANDLMREVNADKISEDAIEAALLSGEIGSSFKEVFPGATSGETSLSPLNQIEDLVSMWSSLGSNSSPCGADLVGDTTEKDIFPGAMPLCDDATIEKEVIPSASPGAKSLHQDAAAEIEKEVFPSASYGATTPSHVPQNQNGDF